MKFNVLIILITISAVSCSHESIYNDFQSKHKRNCLKLPEVQYAECMKQASMSYEEYEQERKKLLNR